MATKSSYLLAVLLIANPFMLLLFQNCSGPTAGRDVASNSQSFDKPVVEFSESITSHLKIK